MKTIIFTGGEVVKSSLITQALQESDFVIGVDSGAKTALEFGVTPQVVIGDMDSLDVQTKKDLEDKGVEFKISPTAKDETDTELAIEYITQKRSSEIIVIGGTYGDRIDHIFANILYVATRKVPITFINGLQKSFVKKGPTNLSLVGQTDDLLSLIPLSEDVTGLQSTGLKWELQEDTLVFGKTRGISNVFLQNEITLSWENGVLFITHTYQER